MSVEFSNAYQEILLENLMSVIKQNFMFQTQLKLNEVAIKQKDEVQIQFVELKKQFDDLNNLYNQAKNDLKQTEIYKNKAEQNNTAHEEKSRIQSALNDELKKTAVFQKQLSDKVSEFQKIVSDKEKEISDLKEYILRLESIAPVTKLKKVISPKVFEQKIKVDVEEKNEVAKVETPKIENKLKVKVLDGSSF
jgi:predicted  nucleic acid-binding Zn-ribbon protein